MPERKTGSLINRMYARGMYAGLSWLCEKNGLVKRIVLGDDVDTTRWNVVQTADKDNWPTFRDTSRSLFDIRRYLPDKGSMRRAAVFSTDAEALLEQQGDRNKLAIAFTVKVLGAAAIVAGELQDQADHDGKILGALRAGVVGRAAMIGVLDAGVFEAATAGTKMITPAPVPIEAIARHYGAIVQ